MFATAVVMLVVRAAFTAWLCWRLLLSVAVLVRSALTGRFIASSVSLAAIRHAVSRVVVIKEL